MSGNQLRQRTPSLYRSEDKIIEMVTQNPRTSLRPMLRRPGILRATVHRVIKKAQMYAYFENYEKRVQFGGNVTSNTDDP